VITLALGAPEILIGYSATAVTVLGATWLGRWYARSGRNGSIEASVLELAYLEDGLLLACRAAMVGLRRAGAVRTGTLLTVAATGRLPADVPPLMAALHRGMRTPQSFSEVCGAAEVLREGTRIHRRLVRRGWLLTPTRRRWLRLAGIPGWLVVIAGVVTIAMTLSRISEPAFSDLELELLGVVTVTAMAHWYLGDVPEVSRAGARALQRARAADAADNRDGTALRPRDAMHRVAVRGTQALPGVDPALAPYVGVVPEQRKAEPHGLVGRSGRRPGQKTV
jgi:uncharacterized protein (TIGR04222 family)